jgi:hypothetical protein
MFKVNDRVVMSPQYLRDWNVDHRDEIWIIVEIGNDVFLSIDPVYYAYPSRYPEEHHVRAFHGHDLCILIEL